MFFLFAGCAAVYFLVAVFFLPETKGKTLEEIEQHFEGSKSASQRVSKSASRRAGKRTNQEIGGRGWGVD